MELIRLTLDNIDNEHICCSINEKKGENCVALKKEWLKQRIKEGLVFLKLDVRGKVFIEYLPAKYAWCPIVADDYMFIDCFWVSGSYKGKGYGNLLLEQCIKDAKSQGLKGVTVISSLKKKPFLSDGKYLRYKGFKVADTFLDYELLYMDFEDGEKPRFKDCVKEEIKDEGWSIYYTNQCPFTEKYALILKEYVEKKNIQIKLKKIISREEAQNMSFPCTTYALCYNGKYITNEIMNEKKFDKLLLKYMD